MTHANFNWFLHTLLFLHNQEVEERINKAAAVAAARALSDAMDVVDAEDQDYEDSDHDSDSGSDSDSGLSSSSSEDDDPDVLDVEADD